MARKPKAQPKPADDYPLDSGCWRLVRDVYRQLKEEHSEPEIMLLDLFEAMDDGRVPYKSRQTQGERKHALGLPGWLSEWEHHAATDGLSDLWLERLEASGILRQAKSGAVFYVWEPALVEKLWPPCEACAESESETVKSVAKRGRPIETKWKLYVTAEFCRLAIEDKEIPGAQHFVDHCGTKDLYPDSRETRRLLSELRQLLL